MAKQSEPQSISPIKGRPMLQWTGKKPLESIEYFPAQEKEMYGDLDAKEFNKLFWGDNLQVLSHLLKEYRGKINMIYIDPPFDSKAEYVKKIKIRDKQYQGQNQSLLEEKQYTDIWENDEYLQFMYERLVILRELLDDTGYCYLHVDPIKGHYLKLIMDEIFGPENFVNQIIWKRTFSHGDVGQGAEHMGRLHDMILFYRKTPSAKLNILYTPYTKKYLKDFYKYEDDKGIYRLVSLLGPGGASKGNPYYEFLGVSRYWVHSKEKMEKLYKQGLIVQTKPGSVPQKKRYLNNSKGVPLQDIWTDLNPVQGSSLENFGYPTQKPEALLERIISTSSAKGGLVLDCFCGGGTTLAVAQKLGRRWIGCDINLGAIQTTTKRLNQILEEQKQKKLLDKSQGLSAFKVYNVNDYEIFKNEIESKEIIMEMYGVEPIKQSYFDGVLDQNLVKVMPLNRVLNKMDVENLLKEISKSTDQFTPKTTTSKEEETYEEGVLIIASGVELDAQNYLRKENKTGVKVEIRDIQADKKNLLFKKPTEAEVEVHTVENKAIVSVKDFYSPILVQKLELENEKQLNPKGKVVIEDFKQIIDSVCIDINYNGKLFNAEIMDIPDKKNLVSATYEHEYTSKGKYTLAIKIVDVLGEEYFETFDISIK